MLEAIFIMGPTAAGKTALALALAERMACEIISVDSALVYRGMDIGTSKPSADELSTVPHHLIDILNPAEAYSAAEFRADAQRLIEEIRGRGKMPLLVGGTMLYFRALEQGLSALPSANEEIRSELEKELSAIGVVSLHRQLSEVDPVSAQRIDANDPQRIMRALEIFRLTGRPMSELWAEQTKNGFPYQFVKIGIAPTERAILHQRIETRFDQMLDNGFVEEVRALKSRTDLHLGLPSMRCVGYRQVWQYLEGEYDYDTMRQKGVVATRQLAKRQLTWMRSEDNLVWFDTEQTLLTDKIWQSIKKVAEI
ncbi:MAG: tRNA (adenosine(37)-N6)-dimethylallyltransferase MiaA [Gammaproteobacteria bacterium]|nr:tRNA (adenosine(37)-N6)-dimethylallyltransferase MiaA [Gammaproteobacteria bacterium]